MDDGDSRLTLVCTEGEKLLLHLPKASAGQVQQNLSSIQQDWDSYVEQCKQNQQNLENSANLLSGLELNSSFTLLLAGLNISLK